jgi:hypothetical protein
MGTIRHEEIVQSFLNSKAVDFNALGQFVAQVGPAIVASGRGDYGVRIGHYNILACFYINPPTWRESIGGAVSGIASEVLGSRTAD